MRVSIGDGYGDPRRKGESMSFITRQPNGLLCRFSSVTDCPSHWNMTDEEYVAFRMEVARDEARMTLKNTMMPFENVREEFAPNNMTEEMFEVVMKQMELPVEDAKKQKEANPKIFEMS